MIKVLEEEGFTKEESKKISDIIDSNFRICKKNLTVPRDYKVFFRMPEDYRKRTGSTFEIVPALSGEAAKEIVGNKYKNCKVTSCTLLTKFRR